MDSLQLAQNNLLRALGNLKIKDKVSIKSMLDKNKMLSINQMNAQLKLTETDENYPLSLPRLAKLKRDITTRGMSNQNFCEPKTEKTFIGDATRMWIIHLLVHCIKLDQKL